jgi:hypothetical protein
VFQDPSLDGEAAAAENMELHGVTKRPPAMSIICRLS